MINPSKDLIIKILHQPGRTGRWVKKKEIFEAAAVKGIERADVENSLRSLFREGVVFYPKDGYVEMVEMQNKCMCFQMPAGLRKILPAEEIKDMEMPHIHLVQVGRNGNIDLEFYFYKMRLKNGAILDNKGIRRALEKFSVK